jgi:hypothetical protein
LGYVFKQGEVPNGRFVSCSLPSSQVVVKNVWPDGSAKIAIVSGVASLAAASPLTASFAVGVQAPVSAALGTAQLRATGAAAVVDCGGFGSVSWTGVDWDTPFTQWVSGPQMSSWVYRKPVGNDPHLVAWLEVRLWATGAVEVLPWIENGYIKVAGPTNKAATYTFTLGGTQRFSAPIDLPHHCRTPLLDGAALSHWLGTDPGLIVRHDTAYLQSTRLVPTYSATVAPDSSVVASLPSTFVPLQLGNYEASMGSGGYQRAIGLLPEWDVLYLTSSSNTPWSALQRNGYSAGRWGIHYRDEHTHRPMRFSDYPNLSRNSSTTGDYVPTESGTPAPHWDIPHHPSVGYMAYLVTGRFFHMEQILFAATRNYLHQVNNLRQFAAGVFLSYSGAATVRGAAWALRTLAQAATVMPDDDPLRAEFIASLEANIEFNHRMYVGQAHNPYGFVTPYGDVYGTPTDGKVTEAPWQQDFYTAAFGYMLAMNPPISSTARAHLIEFFAWKARSIIGRFGSAENPSTDWLYRDAAPYNIVVSFVDSFDGWLNGTGPWPKSWRAIYDATYATLPGAFEDGPLRGGNLPSATSYWGNLQPALAYAVEHAVPGAGAAYSRMTSAPNWPELRSNFNSSPVWSVRAAI